MKGFSGFPAVGLAALAGVFILSYAQAVTAGDCGCRRPAPLLPFAHATVFPAAVPMPILSPGCACAGGLQLMSPGHFWSAGGCVNDSVVLHPGVSSLPAVPAWPGSMTDGGIHYRYPNYSYRYPWNHPGPAVPHVNIVW